MDVRRAVSVQRVCAGGLCESSRIWLLGENRKRGDRMKPKQKTITYNAVKDIFVVQRSHPSTTGEVPGHDEDQVGQRSSSSGRRCALGGNGKG